MSLFRPNYEKPGKGVPEDGSQEVNFVRFFQIVGRKFWGMVGINVMQLIGNLPALAAAGFWLGFKFGALSAGDADEQLWFMLMAGFLAVSTQIVTIGPVQAGFIYTMRNYVREENVFVWSDFMKGVRENWKRSLAVAAIDLFVFYVLSCVYSFYTTVEGNPVVIVSLSKFVLGVLVLLYAMMHLYIYPMMVTLDLNIKQLYGNAWRFAIGKFIPNLLIVALLVGFDVLIFYVSAYFGMIIISIIGYSLTGFLATFYTYPAIDKYIIQKVKS